MISASQRNPGVSNHNPVVNPVKQVNSTTCTMAAHLQSKGNTHQTAGANPSLGPSLGNMIPFTCPDRNPAEYSISLLLLSSIRLIPFFLTLNFALICPFSIPLVPSLSPRRGGGVEILSGRLSSHWLLVHLPSWPP